MSNFLRSFFGSKKSTSKIKPRMQSRRLELIGLEERITPVAQVLVDFTTNTGVLSLASFSADFSVVANANGTLTVNSASIVSAGSSPTVTVTRIGTTNDYTVSVDSGAANVKQLSLIDSDLTDNNFVISSIDSTAFNTDFALNIDTGTGTGDILTINGAVALKGTGALTTAGIEILTIAAAGDITAATGAVGIAATTISTAGDVTTTSGAIGYNGAVTLTGNVATTSTLAGGNLSINGTLALSTSNFTANQGLGNVTGILGGVISGSGALSLTGAGVTTVGFINTTGSVAATATTGDLTFSDQVDAASVNAKSIAGDVKFVGQVNTSAVGGFVSEATLATKATKIEDRFRIGAGANATVTGNLITTASAEINTTSGAILVTGKIDADRNGDDVTFITTSGGSITLAGAIGSSGITIGTLALETPGNILVSSTVVVGHITVGNGTPSTSSVTFSDAVKATGVAGVLVTTAGNGTISFAKTITATGAGSDIQIVSVNGSISVTGNITGKNNVVIGTLGSGSISLDGNITTDTADGDITIKTTTGNVTTSGAISTFGTASGNSSADIIIDTITSGNVTVNGNVSTSGGGDIFLGVNNASQIIISGTGNLTINGTVTTSGIPAGDIYIGASNGTTAVNQPVTAGTAGHVLFINNVATDSFTIASGANISAGDEVYDQFVNAPGIINLGANITALNDAPSISANGIELRNSINLTGSVSMKAVNSHIVLAKVDGAQNLTLEATQNITLTSVGQTTALNTVTVTNSGGVDTGLFTAANVVLVDTTGFIEFGSLSSSSSTTILTSLTTFARAYSVTFSFTSVLAGAPVFLNTGIVGFFGTTSLTTGATITGNSTSTASLAGTIVSGGAFNIGAIGSVSIDTSFQGPDNVQLILNSSSATSTFASKVISAADDQINLLGVGALTLSGDSSADYLGSVNVINGILNVTGKIAGTATTGLTNGTITGAGGEMGILNVNTGTVAPGGTLNTGAITLNAATNYNAAVLTNATASNLKTASAINLGGATLALTSVASGLTVGNVFTIIDNTATQTGINGAFASLPEGASVSAKDSSGNTVAFTISYKGGTNTNDVTLTVASITPSQTATPQPMVAGQPALNKFTAFGADAGGGPLVTITFVNGTYTSFFAYDPSFIGGVRVALGDVNGDGQTDVITGAGPGGGPQVNVYNINNQTGAVSLQSSFFAFSAPSFTGGVYVAAGQTNGDSFADVIVGAGATGGSRVQVYAGSATGVVSSSTLNDFFAYSPAFTGGVVVAAGDRNADGDDEVITAPASNGGYNIKSFNVNVTGNNPTLVDNFFAFNNTTSVGGLSLAVGYFNTGAIADLVIGTTNGAFGVIIDSNTSGIVDVPFEGFTGAIRAGVAESSSGLDYAVALAGPTGGPLVSVFAVFSNLRCVDYLFVMNPEFTGGLFGTPTLPLNAPA